MVPRLKEKYQKEIAPAFKKKRGYKSIMQVPRLLSIHLNQGLAAAKSDTKLLENAAREMQQITGQRPVPTSARRSISNFGLRAGMKIGLRVTLRKNFMFEFLDRLITTGLPNIRDFKGVSEKSFDAQGNYTLGIKEQVIFPELTIDKVDKIRGMNITFVLSSTDRKDSYELLKMFGFPFKNMHKTE